MKIMKIIPLKFIKNHRKSMKIDRKSIKIIENQKKIRNSMKINENRENHSFCNTFHVKSMKILPHNLLKITKINEKSMKIHGNSLKTIENR